MLAIETRYLGPTNCRGSRVKASVSERARLGEPTRTVTLEWNDELGTEDNHRAAAIALIRRLGWTRPYYKTWTQGATAAGYVFTCAGLCDTFTVDKW